MSVFGVSPPRRFAIELPNNRLLAVTLSAIGTFFFISSFTFIRAFLFVMQNIVEIGCCGIPIKSHIQ